MNKQEAYKIVLEDLKKRELFTGIYDGRNGSQDFMYGIHSVMGLIAYEAKDFHNFDDMFMSNMIKCKEENKNEIQNMA